MSVKSYITDGVGEEFTAKVTPDNELLVTTSPFPPIVEKQKTRPFRAFLKDSSGSSDMKVDGSTTPQEFFVSASQTADRYITSLSFVIADAGAALNEFGNIGALTNGCDLFYNSQEGDITVADGLVTNFEFVRAALGNPAFGTGTSAFRASNVSGSSEAFVPIFDLTRIIPPFGIKLDVASTQRVILRVNDNVSTVDQFNCIAQGFDRFE